MRIKNVPIDEGLLMACMAYRLNGGITVRRNEKDSECIHDSGNDAPDLFPVDIKMIERFKIDRNLKSLSHPVCRDFKYTAFWIDFGNGGKLSVYKHKISRYSNFYLMLEMVSGRLPCDMLPEDWNLREKIRKTVDCWKIDLLAGKLSQYNEMLVNLLYKEKTTVNSMKLLADLPQLAMLDSERREREKFLIENCASFHGKPGDPVDMEFEMTHVHDCSFRFNKPGHEIFIDRQCAVNGIIRDEEGIAYPVWFYADRNHGLSLVSGRRMRLTGKVRRVTRNRNTGVMEAMLKNVRLSEKSNTEQGD